jgi:hypothetical protein
VRCFPALLALGAFATALLISRSVVYAQAPGPLSAAHADMSGPLDCQKCHEGGFGVPDAKCLGCHEHQPLRDRIKAGKGFHADEEVKKKPCKSCHAEHKEEPPGSNKGRKTTIDWRPFGGKKNFEHQRTGWPLQGAHRFEECETCHVKKYKKTKLPMYLGLRGECVSCHARGMRPGKDGFENPHEFNDPKLADCLICHTYDNRKVPNVGATKFDHDKTEFPLDGQHLRNPCVKCHQKDLKLFQVEDRTFKDCSGCHKDSHRSVISATRKCQQCHATKTKFEQTKFDHAKETKFTLRGKHFTNRCKECHKIDSPPEKPKMDCEGCHKDFHNGRFGKESCDGCHADGGPGWKEKIHFAHDKKTKFPLTGRHNEIFCTECHRRKDPNNFEKHATTDCAGCHRHQDAHCGQFGFENCGRCHIRGGDRTSKFDHALTRFPLERAHAAVNCERCHKVTKLGDTARCKESVKYTGLDPACLTCHEDIHKGELGAQCQKCHTAGENFKTLVFDHNRDSRFSLVGFHQIVQCDQCHPRRKFKLGDIACIGCHKEDDAHGGALGDNCAECHETTGGAPKFDHNIHTNFKQEGVHARIECARCHFLLPDGTSPAGEKVSRAKGAPPKPERLIDTSTQAAPPRITPAMPALYAPGAPLDLKFRAQGFQCGSCHPDPHRVREALSLDCAACHGFETWTAPPKNGYHEGSGFTLGGAHALVQCGLCHVGSGSLLGRGQECGFCHVQDDMHAGSLGHDCGRCHEQNGWLPTTFTHVDTGYVLEGIHRTLECRDCHQGGNFFIGNQCWNCHLDDYRNNQWHNPMGGGGELDRPGQVIITGGPLNLGQMTSLDCSACHNQFTFYGGTFGKPPAAAPAR